MDNVNTTLDVTTNPGDAFIVTQSAEEWKGSKILDYVATEDASQTVTITEETISQGLISDGVFPITIGFANHTDQPVQIFWWDNATQTGFPLGTVQPGGKQFIATNPNESFFAVDLNDALLADYTTTDEVEQTFMIETSAANDTTEVVDKLSADLQMYVNDGRISSAEGEIITLNDYNADNNELIYYTDALSNDLSLPANFVYSGHFSWTSAALSDKASGCGLLFAGQENADHYVLFLDHSQILFFRSEYDTAIGTSLAAQIGKATGSEKVDFGNPAEADFSLVVNDNHAYIYVNGAFAVQYDLAQNDPAEGKFGFSMISGTTKDYGVHCEITNSLIWTPK